MASRRRRLLNTAKQRLTKWTLSMTRGDLQQRLLGSRAQNEFGVDSFGFSLEYTLAAMGPALWLYKHYFRVDTFGIENVPTGRVLLVANHGGQLPLDGAMIGVAMLTEAQPGRAIRSMVEKWSASLPFVSTFFSRMGQIVGTPENCRRLLNNDEAILVFPEGVRGISKLYSQRYQLQDFGLGFMRLALETKTPVLPIAVIGAEEQAPALFDLKPLAKLMGMPSLPVTPWGLPLPAPTKYRLYFGRPMSFVGSPDDDDVEIEKKVKSVKSAVQLLLNRGLKERRGVFS
jgi:1-acyl-sn-glycerol-3-phosphate acyltransferase